MASAPTSTGLAGDPGDAKLAADLAVSLRAQLRPPREDAIADRPGSGQSRNASADDYDMHVSPSLLDQRDDSCQHVGIGVR